MRTTCPTCDTGYTVPDERIGAKGRKVRCTRCGEEWRIFLASDPQVEPAARPRPAPPPPPEPALPDPAENESQSSIDDLFATGPVETAFDEAAMRSEIASEAEPEGTTSEPAEPSPVDTIAETQEPAPPSPLPPGRRVRIRTKRHFPRLGKEVVAKLASRVSPFVGPAVFLAACLTLTGVYVFRQAIVAAAPDLAGLYSALGAPVNLRGLVFGRIETLREIDNGQPVLVVEGSVANVSERMREVPALRFALRGTDTQELYAWSIDPKSTSIESGDTIRFRTRLAAPPDMATEVQVRFVERRSQHAGLP